MGQWPHGQTRASLRRTSITGRRAIPALLSISLLGLILAGCGGSSKPQISLRPATITGPVPTATTRSPAPKRSAKLTAFEYRKLKAVKARIRAANSLLVSNQPAKLTALCRSVGQRTKLLKEEGRSCADMVPFAVSTLSVGKCFKALKSSSATPGSASYLSGLYSCDRSAAPIGAESKKLASDTRAIIATVRHRGFSGRCYSLLAGPGSVPANLSKLASDTTTMVAAGKNQDLASAAAATQSWGLLLQQIGKEMNAGPKSIKVCRHT